MDPLHSPDLTPASEGKASKVEHINLRVTTAEKCAIEAKAKLAGLTTGEYMRRAALGRTIVERIPPELRRLLSTTGSNLNQLTRLANSGKLPGVGIEQLNDLLTRLLQTLR